MYWYCLELHSQLFLPALVLANVPVILIYLRIKIDFELLNKSRSGNFIFLIFFTVIFNFWIFYLLIQIKLLRKKTLAVDVIFSFFHHKFQTLPGNSQTINCVISISNISTSLIKIFYVSLSSACYKKKSKFICDKSFHDKINDKSSDIIASQYLSCAFKLDVDSSFKN